MHMERRGRCQAPFDLGQHLKLVAHVHGIVVGLDFLDRGRSLGKSQLQRMEGPVQNLPALVGHHGVAHRFRGKGETHAKNAKLLQ